jgi:hypothetical protein
MNPYMGYTSVPMMPYWQAAPYGGPSREEQWQNEQVARAMHAVGEFCQAAQQLDGPHQQILIRNLMAEALVGWQL